MIGKMMKYSPRSINKGNPMSTRQRMAKRMLIINPQRKRLIASFALAFT